MFVILCSSLGQYFSHVLKINHNFFVIPQELRKAFSTHGLLLSVSISGYKEIISRAYDLSAISKAVDFMTIMSYDYHGSWEPVTGHVRYVFMSPERR